MIKESNDTKEAEAKGKEAASTLFKHLADLNYYAPPKVREAIEMTLAICHAEGQLYQMRKQIAKSEARLCDGK